MKEVYIFVTAGNNPSADFGICIYEKDSLPLKRLTPGEIIAHAQNGNEWVRVDLSDKHIPVNDGIYVAVLWISEERSPMVGLTRAYGYNVHAYNRNLTTNEWYDLHGDAPMIYCTYSY